MLILLLLLINRALKALSDILKSSFDSSLFSKIKNRAIREWCNAADSWYLKWKIVDGKQVPQTKKLWYYLWIFTPKFVERFPYSSTWLVKYTDLWHTSEGLRRLSEAGIVLMSSVTYYMEVNMEYSFMYGIIPNLLTSVLPWDNLFIYVLNCVILISAVQLIGFTLFYDYILKKENKMEKIKEILKKIKKLSKKVKNFLWKYSWVILGGIMLVVSIYLFINQN